MVINGVNLPDIDVADALVMERYEHAHDNVAKAMNDLQPRANASQSLSVLSVRLFLTFLMRFLVTVRLKRFSAKP